MPFLSARFFIIPALLLASAVSAAPEITLNITAEQEVEVINAEGEAVTERRAAENASPGDVVFYTLRYRNSGDEAATNVNIDNPLPEGTAYVADSAWGDDSEILFSIDGGQTFKKPGSLTYNLSGEDGSEQKKADPEQYTAIRWVVSEIPAGSAGEVGFQARIK